MYSYRNTAQDSHKLLIQGDITPILTKISPTKRWQLYQLAAQLSVQR